MIHKSFVLLTILATVSCCPYLRSGGDGLNVPSMANPHEDGRKLSESAENIEETISSSESNPRDFSHHEFGRRMSESMKNITSNNIDIKCYVTSAYCESTYGARATASKSNICYTYTNLLAQINAWAANVAASSNSVYTFSTTFGAAVRLAFHDAGEVNMANYYDRAGPDGCLSDDSANHGLVEYDSVVYQVFEPVWQQYCNKISRADFWVLLAKLCMEYADPTNTLNIQFQYGRKDASSCSDNNRLPNAMGDLTEYKRVFVTQMGLTLNDAATLLGGHTVGHVHPDVSGFGFYGDTSSGLLNAWDDTPHLFDNHYHFNLEAHDWVNELAPYRTFSSQAQWRSWNNTKTIMLPADMALGYQLDFDYRTFKRQTCGPHGAGPWYSPTGLGQQYGCSPANTTMPVTCPKVCDHGNSNADFLADFAIAYNKMTCVGYGLPAYTDGATASGKLGTLTHINLATC